MKESYPGKRIIELARKMDQHTITPEEAAEYNEWFNSEEKDVLLPAFFADSDEELRLRILASIEEKTLSVLPLWKRFARITAAAILILSAGGGLYFYLHKSEDKISTSETSETAKQFVINPGSKKTILTLEDGSDIVLDDSAIGILARQADALIKKENKGLLVYNSSPASSPALDESPKYNSIVVPRGGEYQITLSDGTRVWLNAASSLRFPTAFKSKERKVELTGEAYFEVAANKMMPFIVAVNQTEIEVLGTGFNINAYDRPVNTTLVQGAVKLKNDSKELILQPGKTGTMERSGLITVRPADLEAVIAWKEGYFVFHDESIKDIMEKVARWYDVDVSYKGGVENKKLYGKLSRTEKLDDLLKSLELTGIIHLKTTGRMINVTP